MYCIASPGTDATPVDCTGSGVMYVLSQSEVAEISPFALSLESAVAIGGAILMVMAVAFVLRLIRKAIESQVESEI